MGTGGTGREGGEESEREEEEGGGEGKGGGEEEGGTLMWHASYSSWERRSRMSTLGLCVLTISARFDACGATRVRTVAEGGERVRGRQDQTLIRLKFSVRR